MKKALLTGAVLGMFMLSAVVRAETVLRFAEYGPDKGPRAQALHWFADELAKRSDGRLKMQINFGGSLIKAKGVLKGVASGIGDLGTIVGVYTPTELLNFRVGDTPSGNDDTWVGVRAAYQLATENATVQAEFATQKAVYLANFTTSTVILACRTPVASLADLKGLKIRSNPPHSEVFREYGASIVNLPFPEVYPALDKGIVDCAQAYWSSVMAYRLHEVAKHITALKWSQNLGFGVVMNKRRFDSLPAADRDLLVQLGSELTDHNAKETIAAVDRVKAAVAKDASVTVHELGAQDQAALIAAGLKQADAFAGDKGVLADYMNAVRRFEGERQSKGYPWK